MFANMFRKMLEDSNCLALNGDLQSDNLMQAFRDGKIDAAVLASTLGGKTSLRNKLE